MHADWKARSKAICIGNMTAYLKKKNSGNLPEETPEILKKNEFNKLTKLIYQEVVFLYILPTNNYKLKCENKTT